ncbi:MAG TPA: [Fe-Fe] hydrogenase large subunit C-terminal domain-containing protein [bacterium]|nr:[Fe-Fe] hydrogenase large subunit C-terminal domain-containing protein [bacterium]HPG44690.1 [Fe-Fe] hydrogenase large subunit C-terminal domain-containing protein [bacterium]HPM99403.1 [Fe-Fe] hydrogenase large subunit C-terminal domain-containing protein [bacterium]
MKKVVWTIEERCKQCYTCIRECPAKAIKVEKGQAEVIEERCIGCGHCVRVCTQKAKAVLNSVQATLVFLTQEKPVAALLAPSFPAAYSHIDPEKIVGALRECGFKVVIEVAFGADLINQEIAKLAKTSTQHQWQGTKRPIIASSCPAVVNYIEKYVPDLIDNIMPTVSPMVAAGRAVRRIYGSDMRLVFIGPCVAKKMEIQNSEVSDAVDEVLTFQEMEQLFNDLHVNPEEAMPSWFDPPHPFLGRIYPISGGLIRSSGLPYDLMDNEIIMAEGKQHVLNVLECVQNGEIKAQVVDLLFCEGCINGPFIDQNTNYFTRKQKIVEYAETRRERSNYAEWAQYLERCKSIKIDRSYHRQEIHSVRVPEGKIKEIFAQINKFSKDDELNCGACGYTTCRDYARAVHQGLAEREMCLPFLIENLKKTKFELQDSLRELAETQEMLIQHEKLASVGQLAAGVAHEVNNPLGSIMLYAHLILKELGEQNEHSGDLKFIMEEAKRCQKIVAGLLNFSRQGQLNLRNHRLQDIVSKMVEVISKQTLFRDITINVDIDENLDEIEIDSDQLYQVFLNLAVNAAEAMPDGGTLTISASTDEKKEKLTIQISDTGVGIKPENFNKLFTPFFTTKQIGKGTGLGLAIVYGIIKMHRGNVVVKSEVNKGTTFTIMLPLQTHVVTNEILLQ